MNKKSVKVGCLCLTSIASVALVLVNVKSSRSSSAFGIEHDHSGYHYSYLAPTDDNPGHLEFWTCCGCLTQWLEEPANGSFTSVSDDVMSGGISSEHIAYLPKLTETFMVGSEADLSLGLDIGYENLKVKNDFSVEKGIVLTGEHTLDLNGHTISEQSDVAATDALITNDGELTITSSVEGGKLTYECSSPDTSNGYASNTITNRGILTVDSNYVTVENTTVGSTCYSVDNNSTVRTASLTIDGGNFISKGNSSVRMFANSKTNENNVTVNDGFIEGNYYALRVHNCSNDVKLNAVVNGGEFESTQESYNYNVSMFDSSLTFDGEISIKDGKFNDMAANLPAGVISGGTWAVNPYKFVAAGHKVNENVDGTFTVVEGTKQATITKSEIVLAVNDSSASVKVNVKENDDLNGLIIGHVTTNLAADGVERFYLLGVKELKLGLYEYQGGTLKLIKESANTISAGVHTLKAEICSDFSLAGYVDGASIITASVGEITATGFSAIVESGRVGIYSESNIYNYSDLAAESGAIDLATYKAACIAQGSTFKHDRYTAWFNPGTSALQFVTSLGEVTQLRNVGGYTEYADALINGVTNATTLDEIDAAMFWHQQAIINAQIALTVYELGQIAPNIHAYGQLFSNAATAVDCNLVTLSGDPAASDGRWYTPACYKLRCSGFTCILDKLEAEAASITTRAAADALASKYALDIARAACAREYEFVYWAKRNADPTSVSNEWSYLYTYYGADATSFAYNGSVFTAQEVDVSVGYRLNGIYYSPSALTTFDTTLNTFAWQIANQI